MFKTEFTYEKYLDVIVNDRQRMDLSRLRTSSHKLEIETGGYENIERINRVCKCCNQNVVESEYHFISCCQLYSDLRENIV